MGKCAQILAAIMLSLVMMKCEPAGEKVIGSRNHDIHSAYATQPQILANGIATTEIVANVRSKDGVAAEKMRVHFETNYGKIDEYAVTDNSGNARVILTSAASDTDIIATVTAVVMDTTFIPLAKSGDAGYRVKLTVPGFEDQPRKIKGVAKAEQQTDNRASIKVKFLGVDLQAVVDDSILTADGVSETRLEIRLRETTSRKVIEDAEIRLLMIYGTIIKSIKTDNQGMAEAYLKAAKKVVTDTLFISYGNEISRKIALKYLNPKFELYPRTARVPADGVSKVQMTATLKTQQNTPIAGAKIRFSSSAGIISESAITDNYGQAIANLISDRRPDSLVKVFARFNSLRDSAIISFGDIDVSTIRITSDEEPILRDGIATKQLTITAKNSLGLPVPNIAINLTTNIGKIPGAVVTDQSGNASCQFYADAGSADATATITATAGSAQASHTVKLLGITMTVSANPASILADGKSTSTIRVELKQTTSHVAVTNHAITFAANVGLIPTNATSDNQGVATTTYTGSNVPGIATISVTCGKLIGETKVSLLANYPKTISLSADSEPILRDGVATKSMTVTATNELGQPVPNVAINLQANLGSVPASVITDSQGKASFSYTSDAGSADATATVTATVGSLLASHTVKLLGITMTVSANPDSIAADGKSTSLIRVELKQTTSQLAIGNYSLRFAVDYGTIPATGTTDSRGVANATYQSSTKVGWANITVTAGQLNQKIGVYLFGNYPNSIVLAVDQNFISVRGTGGIQQAIITATILGVTGQPVGNDYGVRFRIVSGPGGGEQIEPAGASSSETSVIRTVNGVAQAKLLAGNVSGTVQVRAELVDYPYISAQTTNIVIRSGPAYMWVDSTNINHVIPHATLTVEPGKFNVNFGNPVHEIKVTVYFADKYNNPVENGTVVYFTTTGGMITTNAMINEQGKATVLLQDVNPFPYLKSSDPNQLTAMNIPNPNNEIYNDTLKLNTDIPDFEISRVYNTLGTLKENDGVAVILAYTWGKDQNGKDIKVWAMNKVVYSVGLLEFTATTDRSVLAPNQSATITIRVYDRHGNPVAAGSKLTVSTDAGELSETSLMPSAEKYGWGTTKFQVTLTNNLKSTDEPKTAHVKIELDSTNGDGKLTLNIDLKNTP